MWVDTFLHELDKRIASWERKREEIILNRSNHIDRKGYMVEAMAYDIRMIEAQEIRDLYLKLNED